MKYEIKYTARFKKDYKACKTRGFPMDRLLSVVERLGNDETLPEVYRDHALQGDYAGYRDCHIRNDWVLIYRRDENVLILTLTRTGTHADVF